MSFTFHLDHWTVNFFTLIFETDSSITDRELRWYNVTNNWQASFFTKKKISLSFYLLGSAGIGLDSVTAVATTTRKTKLIHCAILENRIVNRREFSTDARKTSPRNCDGWSRFSSGHRKLTTTVHLSPVNWESSWFANFLHDAAILESAIAFIPRARITRGMGWANDDVGHGMDRSDPRTRTGIWDPLCSPHHRSSGGCLVPNKIVVTQTCASFNDTWSSFEIVFELESNALIAISADLRSEFVWSNYTNIALVNKGCTGK